MRMQVRSWVTVATLALACGACDGNGPTGSNGRLRATINGSVQANYDGTGDFHLGADERTGGGSRFSVYSAGTGTASGQSFLLQRNGAELPARGVYPLGLSSGFTARYIRQVDGTMQAFVAQSGEVEVLQASAKQIEGRFHLVGFRYCSRDATGNRAPEGPCTVPGSTIAGAPTIEITGSFTVTPRTDGFGNTVFD